VVTLLLAFVVPAAAQPVVATPGVPQGPRTGMIVGQVVDQDGHPVPEAIVTMSMPRFLQNVDLRVGPDPAIPSGRVMADADGRFFFVDLPAGEYYLAATKEGFAQGVFGEQRPYTGAPRLVLAEGERRIDVKIPVWKFAVLAGTVVDEVGEPVVGISVRALIRDVIGGATRFGNMQLRQDLVPGAVTDDRGMFRLPQLFAGTYVVLVPSQHATVPSAVVRGALDTAVRNELLRAGVRETPQLGQPGTQQMGDFALVTSNLVLIAPPPSADGRRQTYPTTFYPAATRASEATQVTVRYGEERTDLHIALVPVPAVRVSGRLVTPDGSIPQPMTLRLRADAAGELVSYDGPIPDRIGFETAIGLSDATGRFAFEGVPAGDYVITHAGWLNLSINAQQGIPGYWISERLSVGADDLEEVRVDLRQALRVEGRVELLGAADAPPLPPMIARGSVTFQTPFAGPGQFFASGENGEFWTVAAGGDYIAQPLQANGLFVHSVTLGGKDITDRVFELREDATSFVVTYTDRPSRVTGVVKDARGTASATAVVLAFPVDAQRWVGYGTSSRLLVDVPVSAEGVYTFNHLPAGDYNVIAIEYAESEGWRDPATLKRLASQATKITVGVGDPQRTLDLGVRGIR